MTSASTIAEPRMIEAARHAADDREAQRPPQPHRALVGADHEVELHRAVAAARACSSECAHIARATPRPLAGRATM